MIFQFVSHRCEKQLDQLEGWGYFSLSYSSSLREVRAGTRTGQKLEAKNHQRNTELAPSGSCLSQLSYMSQYYLPRNGTAHSGLDPPLSINNPKTPHIGPQFNLTRPVSQLRLPLPRQCLFVSVC